MPTADYAKRTEQNVLNSDGTLIVSNCMLTGGSALTEFLAEKYAKPYNMAHLVIAYKYPEYKRGLIKVCTPHTP
jgi:hypothetical protein